MHLATSEYSGTESQQNYSLVPNPEAMNDQYVKVKILS